MLSIERALWYIELELGSQLDLGRVARHCNMSPFALARLFALSTGWSVMRYIRARRLSQAALTLRQGAPDILQVALDAGYGSHEAFTRAFCDLFGFTPKQVRGHEDEHLSLVEPLRMKERKLVTLSEPCFETRAEFFIAGLGDRFTFDKNEGIVGLWQAFSPYLGQVPNQVNNGGYGLCCNPEPDGSFEYIAGTEVSCVEGLPPAFRYFRCRSKTMSCFGTKAISLRSIRLSSPFSITGCLNPNMSLPTRLSSNSTALISHPPKGRGTWTCGYRLRDAKHPMP